MLYLPEAISENKVRIGSKISSYSVFKISGVSGILKTRLPDLIFKRFLNITTYLCLVFLILLLTPPLVHSTPPNVIGTGTITAERLSVRTKPDRYSKLVFVIKKGRQVHILKKEDGWLKIIFENKTGYIRNREKYVRINSPLLKTVKAVTVIKKKPELSVKKEVPEETAVIDEATEITQKKEEVKKIDQKISDTNQEIKEFSEKEELLIKGLDDVEISLNNARKQVREMEPVLKEIDDELKILLKKQDILIQSIKQNEGYAKERLVALYKVNQLGKIQIIASSESIYDFLNRKNAIETILKNDMDLIESQYEKEHELELFLGELEKKKEEKQKLTAIYKNQARIISVEKKKRTQILTAIKKEKKVRLASIAALKENSRKLEDTIRELELTLNRKKVFKESFIANRGKLEMPVKGRITSYFGEQTNDATKAKIFQHGIEIKTDRGEPVRSVFGGEILYADWLRGYGNMIIIHHGDNYYTLYAHAEELFKTKGDFVETQEVIATSGDTGSLKGALLHFEVRHRGKSVNPMNWLKIK